MIIFANTYSRDIVNKKKKGGRKAFKRQNPETKNKVRKYVPPAVVVPRTNIEDYFQPYQLKRQEDIPEEQRQRANRM